MRWPRPNWSTNIVRLSRLEQPNKNYRIQNWREFKEKKNSWIYAWFACTTFNRIRTFNIRTFAFGTHWSRCIQTPILCDGMHFPVDTFRIVWRMERARHAATAPPAVNQCENKQQRAVENYHRIYPIHQSPLHGTECPSGRWQTIVVKTINSQFRQKIKLKILALTTMWMCSNSAMPRSPKMLAFSVFSLFSHSSVFFVVFCCRPIRYSPRLLCLNISDIKTN